MKMDNLEESMQNVMKLMKVLAQVLIIENSIGVLFEQKDTFRIFSRT